MAELIYIGESKIHGKGLFAAVDIPAITPLFIVAYLSPFQMQYLGRLINHANNSNTASLQVRSEAVWQFSLRDIKAGEELTTDYRDALPYFSKDTTGFTF